MRIDEDCINHNAIRLIDELATSVCDFTDQDDANDHIRIATLGEIAGICELAKALKKVLKQ